MPRAGRPAKLTSCPRRVAACSRLGSCVPAGADHHSDGCRRNKSSCAQRGTPPMRVRVSSASVQAQGALTFAHCLESLVALRSCVLCRLARRLVPRPVLHLVRLAAVGDSAASAAFLVLPSIHFTRRARRQRAAVQPLGRRCCCSDSRCRLIFAFGRRDAFSNVALLQHAASLQPAGATRSAAAPQAGGRRIYSFRRHPVSSRRTSSLR
jgi:hypothetical protein